MDLAGAEAHPEYPLDGCVLSEILRDPAAGFDRPMFWRMKHRDQRAHRQGDWKYLRVDGQDYLFNVSEDARERANLASRHPDRLTKLHDAWEAWNKSMPAIPSDASVKLGYGLQDMPQR